MDFKAKLHALGQESRSGRYDIRGTAWVAGRFGHRININNKRETDIDHSQLLI